MFRRVSDRVETKIFVSVFSRQFRTNFFRFSHKKIATIFRENFREIFRFRRKFLQHFLVVWRKASRTQKFLQKTFAKTETFCKNYPGNTNFSRRQQFFAKTKIFAKRHFVKIERIFASFRFSRKFKKGFSFQP
jgi:hypothetical protein